MTSTRVNRLQTREVFPTPEYPPMKMASFLPEDTRQNASVIRKTFLSRPYCLPSLIYSCVALFVVPHSGPESGSLRKRWMSLLAASSEEYASCPLSSAEGRVG